MDLSGNGTYSEKDFVTMSFANQANWVRFTTLDSNNTSSSDNPDNKYYHTNAIATSGYVDVNLVFTVSNTFGNSNLSGTEDYTKTEEGKIGVMTYQEMQMKWRESFLNIDMQIIDELGDLFMKVW